MVLKIAVGLLHKEGAVSSVGVDKKTKVEDNHHLHINKHSTAADRSREKFHSRSQW